MAQDIEKLTLTLEANIKNFERDMEKARRSADKSLGDIEKKTTQSMDSVTRSSSAAGTAMQAFIRTLAVGAPVAFTAWLANSIIGLDKLAEEAKRAEVSLRVLDALRFASQSAGISDPNSIGKDLAGLGSRAHKEFLKGEGEITKQLEANNLKLEERKGVMKDSLAIFLMAADLMKSTNSEVQKMNIAEAFGLGKYVPLLEQGSEAIRKSVGEALNLNVGLEDAANKAAEFKKAWDEAWANWETGGKQAILGVMNLLQTLAGAASSIFQSIGRRALGSEVGNKEFSEYTNTQLGRARSLYADQPGISKALGDEWARRNPMGGLSDFPSMDQRTIQQQIGVSKGTYKAPPGGSSGGGSSASEKKNEYDREIQSISKKTRALEGEAAAIGKTVFEGARAEAMAKLELAAKQANINLSPDQIAANEKIAEAYAKISEKLKDLQLANSQWIELQNFAGNQMIGLFKGAMTGAEGLRDAVKKLADSLLDATLQAMILGKGPLAGLFGTGTSSNGGVGGIIGGIFGAIGGAGAPLKLAGALAGGGPAMAGRPYLVGEKGPEIMVPGHSGSVFPIAMGGGGGGGGNVVNVQQQFTISGAFTKDDARAMAMQAATRAGQATRQSVLAELNSQRKRA